MKKRYELSTDLYIFVEMPLNTGSYFFIFPFEHALESTLLLRKPNNHW